MVWYKEERLLPKSEDYVIRGRVILGRAELQAKGRAEVYVVLELNHARGSIKLYMY
jgi:hypothetical protein